MAKLTIGCFSSVVGSMSADFALKLADAVSQKGHQVDLWLSGNGTSIIKSGQKKFLDYSYNQERVKTLLQRGVKVTACEACSEARGLHKKEIIEGVSVYAMDWFLASSFGADRVLLIGGD
jgi:tRNA 2-thiouridine synthesizing protein D